MTRVVARSMVDALESRRLLADPSISLPESITIPTGTTVQVPVSGDADSTLDFDADTSGGLNASIPSGNPWLELSTDRGTMRFQLFADLAPNTVRKISGLVKSGFYDGLTFHDVVDQNGYRYAVGGSPDGTAAGKADFIFDDEFNPNAAFTYRGQLAMASSGKDLNSSQFFVTGSEARGFDFNSTIFGQLTRGSKTLEEILATANDSSASATTIRSARLVSNVNDAVVRLQAGSKPGTRNVIVTAVDEEGRSVERTITVTVVPDSSDPPPILQPIEYGQLQRDGDKLDIDVDAIDLNGDSYDIKAAILAGGEGIERSSIDQSNRRITIQFRENWSGVIKLKIGVRGTNAVVRGSITTEPGDDVGSFRVYDTQVIAISVGGRPIERTQSIGTFAAQVGRPIDADAVLATFDSDDDASASDFAASVDWGDGTVTGEATIERIKRGTFAVLAPAGHVYDRAADGMPVAIEIAGANGTAATVHASVNVSDPATLAADGTLTLRGTVGPDILVLATDDVGTLRVALGGDAFDFPLSDVKRITVELFAGDDTVTTIDATDLPPMTIYGGDGNDTIYGGDNDDQIYGGDGNDQIYGNGGNDYVYGGSGKDTLYGGAGKNYLWGEDDEDRIIGGGGRDYVNGGDGADKLYGRSGDDTIEGGGGTDRLYGEDGNDLLIGGSSNDRLYGGNDDDTLFGNAGNDTLNGGFGTNYRGDKDSRDENDVVIDLID